MDTRHLDNKRRLYEGLAALAEARPDGIGAALARLYHPSVEWRGSHPLNEMRGIDEVEARVWAP